MFGGVHLNATLGQTWEWDGRVWRELQPSQSPSPRSLASMAYDAARRRMVLFGGYDSGTSTIRGDTWEWDGVNWTQRSPVTSPPPRSSNAFAFDAQRGRCVLFGGLDATGLLNDTWEWDGSTWLQRTPTNAPSPRLRPGMAYDSDRAMCVLFGGATQVGGSFTDTWEWDGNDWLLRSPAMAPLGRTDHGMAYDTARRRVVLTGGFRNGSPTWFIDTWEWDGSNWSQRAPVNTPSKVCVSGIMAYDTARERCVFYQAGTWSYAATQPALFAPFGNACPGTAGSVTLGVVPGYGAWLGDTLQLALGNLPANQPVVVVVGASRTRWGSIPLPFLLDALGAPGCSLHTSVATMTAAMTQGNRGVWSQAIPDDLALRGGRFYTQALAVDPAANPAGFTLTTAAEVTIGGK
jgi:hypothetical protein